MPLYVRRHGFALNLILILVAACSSSGSGPSNDPPPTVVDNDDGGTNPDSGSPADGLREVRVTRIDKLDHASGDVVEQPVDVDLLSGAAIVKVDGVERTIVGTVRDGALVISDVPRGPYVLELREPSGEEGEPPFVVRYPVDGADVVRLGQNWWRRRDVVSMTDETKLALTVNAPAGFATGDTFSWFGVRSYFYREVRYSPDVAPEDGQTNVPAEDATSSAAWTIDGLVLDEPWGPDASGLPTADDDLMIVQSRRRRVKRDGDRFDPWTSFNQTEAIGVLDASGAAFANDITNTVTGTLAPPTKQSVTVEIAGDSFASLRDEVGYPEATRISASVSLSHEAGQGPGYLTSLAPISWSFGAQSVAAPKPEYLHCFPEELGTACDPACEVPCSEATGGYVHPGNLSYTFDAPRLYSTGMRDVYSVSFTFSLRVELPGGSRATLTAPASTSRVLTGSKLTFALGLGPVRNLRIDGQILPWEGGEPLAAPPQTISFEPPSQGTPEYYEAQLREVMNEVGSRIVARLYTRDTTVKLPADVLRAGRAYFFVVNAMRDGRDFAEPEIAKGDDFTRTGVFSPPFVIAE